MNDDDDEFTELVDADITRVDLVDRAANGMRFLIAKREDGSAGLLDAAFVRDLIAKSEPETDSRETVTMTGSPGAIAKLIHEASRPAAEPAEVVKDLDLDDSPDGMDPTLPLAAPDDDEAPGSPSDPGSPAWEAIDAATARKWTSILARAKGAIDMLAQREMLEAASGDEDAIDNSMDLDDACCAIDYAISVLAPFAVAEQAEADMAADMMAVGKTLAAFDTAPLDTIEAFGQIRKAGRVLSTANEMAIRGAVESLQKVLASLPQAPTAPEDGQSVAKETETDMPKPTLVEDTITDAGEQPKMGTAKPEPIAKADGEKTPMTVVYDQKGRLIGIVDPADVTPVSNSEADPAADPDDGADTPAADAAPDASDLTPAPAAEVGTPADAVPDDVTKSTTDKTDTDITVPDAVLKSIAKDAATAALADYTATQEQVIAKQAADHAQLAEEVEKLRGLVKALEEQPATPKVFTNGAVPPPSMLRGQNAGVPVGVDAAQAQQMKKGLYGAVDAHEQNRIANEMQTGAIAMLQEIRQRPTPQ